MASNPAHIKDVREEFVSLRIGQILRFAKDTVGTGCAEGVHLYDDLYAYHKADGDTEADVHAKIARQLFYGLGVGDGVTPSADQVAYVDDLKASRDVLKAVCDAWDGVAVTADADRPTTRRRMMRRS